MSESVYCGCGAQWHGEYVTRASHVIESHEARYGREGSSCELIAHDIYSRLFPKKCRCSNCHEVNKRGRGPKSKSNPKLRRRAATALYDALKMLLADIEDYQRVNNLGGENNHAQIAARAAIAKAERR